MASHDVAFFPNRKWVAWIGKLCLDNLCDIETEIYNVWWNDTMAVTSEVLLRFITKFTKYDINKNRCNLGCLNLRVAPCADSSVAVTTIFQRCMQIILNIFSDWTGIQLNYICAKFQTFILKISVNIKNVNVSFDQPSYMAHRLNMFIFSFGHHLFWRVGWSSSVCVHQKWWVECNSF